MSGRAIPSGKRLVGRVEPPSSKSVSNRYLTLALLAGRRLTVERLLASQDITTFLAAFEALGWTVEADGTRTLVAPGRSVPSAEIWCEASGTMLRLLTAALTTLDGHWRLDGTKRLRQRPLAPLVHGLRRLGAEIVAGDEDRAPLAIHGGRLGGGRLVLDAGLSSQFASALILAATRAGGPVTIELSRWVSKPYLDLTLAALREFGGRCEAEGGLYRVSPGLAGTNRVVVEGDFSSAAYWAAGAALTGGEVVLGGLSPTSAQGDRGFLAVLTEMGATVEWTEEGLVVGGERGLLGVDCDLGAMPDQVPTLAVLAPFAHGVTRISGVPHLRHKESDRLAAVSAGLRAAGAQVEEGEDGLLIPGIWAEQAPPVNPVELDPVDDHRLAMSFAILGLRRPGISVGDAGVVAKSYPGFWRDFEILY